jgi:hypothetical protein
MDPHMNAMGHLQAAWHLERAIRKIEIPEPQAGER